MPSTTFSDEFSVLSANLPSPGSIIKINSVNFIVGVLTLLIALIIESGGREVGEEYRKTKNRSRIKNRFSLLLWRNVPMKT